MKTYMPLDGFRWSCDSDSALCDIPQTNVLGQAGGGGIVAKYAKTICFGKTIFAFLMLNTMTSAHNKIFGAKFLSFERADIVY